MLFIFLFSATILSLNKKPKNTYSFKNNQRISFTLQDPQFYLQNNDNHNIFSRFFAKKTANNVHENDKEWYYVHFSTENFEKVNEIIELKSGDQMLKNTFMSFMSKQQLQKISNLSLVKRLEPEDKISIIGGPINTSNFLIVSVSSDFKLNDTEFYTVESKLLTDSYIIKINNEKYLNDQKALKKLNEKVVNYLASIPSVKRVSTYVKPTIKNNVAAGFTQKNSKNFVQNQQNQITVLERYFNDRQITGEGEIITVIDTLIDIYHSMFRDNNVEVVFNQPMADHRKFVYYGYPGELSDWIANIQADEHGTHVSGTAAGKNDCTAEQDSTNSTELFDGNAPDAKILYAGQLNSVPVQEQLDLMAVLGSKISTNSWGVDGFNDDVNYEYGLLSYIDSSSIFIYAAGNAYEETGNFSVCDPGGSKNVLTIGALGEFYDSMHVFILQNSDDSNINVELISLIDPEPYQVGTIGTTPLATSIVVINGGASGNSCDTIDQPQISVIYASSPEQLYWTGGCNIEKSHGILYTYQSQQLMNVLNAGPNVYLQDITGYNNTPIVTHAPYSSTGPANKGILKPDVMAPGTRIISAKSLENSDKDHGCDTFSGNALIFMQGTSMATPNAAGAAALVRQYFKTKWPVESVDIDGPTVRALIINSCVQQPAGTLTPNTMFGHGHIDLSTVLPIEGNFGVQITKQASITENSQEYTRINVKSNKVKLQITLSYLDPLTNPSSYIPLTRDLDLIVRSSSNKIYKGDHLPNGDTQHFSTNEKVIINEDQIEPGEYYIQIYSLNFLDAGVSDTGKYQNFSVVVTGDIDNGYLDFQKSRACGCDHCSEIHPLHCKCDNTSFGEICQSKIDVMTEERKSYKVPSMLLQLVRIDSDNPIKTIGIAASGNAAQHVEAFIDTECHLNIGEYSVQLNIGEDVLQENKLDFRQSSLCLGLFNNNFEETTFHIEKDFTGPKGKGKKLSGGQIAGIVIGCLCGVSLIITLVICLVRRCGNSVRDF